MKYVQVDPYVCVQVYHVACFNCVMCKKKLDANLTEKDGDIYCKGSPSTVIVHRRFHI